MPALAFRIFVSIAPVVGIFYHPPSIPNFQKRSSRAEFHRIANPHFEKLLLHGRIFGTLQIRPFGSNSPSFFKFFTKESIRPIIRKSAQRSLFSKLGLQSRSIIKINEERPAIEITIFLNGSEIFIAMWLEIFKPHAVVLTIEGFRMMPVINDIRHAKQ